MMTMTGKVIFTGGGTGGHVYPALATIEALRSRGNFEVCYVGGYQGIENRIVPSQKIPFRKIWISGLQRYFTLKNLLFPLKVGVSLLQSLLILRRFKPAVVVGTGGYVSGPVVYLASRLRIPTLIQEQDTFPGVTTRLLSRYSDIVCIPLPEVARHLEKVRGEVVVTGVPVRKSLKFVDKKTAAERWGMDHRRPVVLVFGGSQGAQSLNAAMAKIIPSLREKFSAQVLWQTGSANFARVQAWPVAREAGVMVKEYIDTMDLAYSVADIIVSRAGAITLAELALAGKPCVLVPYPHAAADHQQKNAETIARYGAALVIREGEGFEKSLQSAIENLLTDTRGSGEMGLKWREIARPDAADKIVDQVIKLMTGNHENQTGKN